MTARKKPRRADQSTKKSTETAAQKLRDPEFQKRLARAQKGIDSAVRPLIKAAEKSQRLGERDFTIRVNKKA